MVEQKPLVEYKINKAMKLMLWLCTECTIVIKRAVAAFM